MVGGAALDGARDDVARLFLRLVARALLDFAHGNRRVVVRFFLDAGDEHLPRFFHRHVGNALQLRLLALVHGLGFFFQALHFLKLLVQALFASLQIVELFVERFFTLVDSALLPLHFIAAVAHLFVKL